MAAKYWLKLYHEMLDDPKIGQLRAPLRWRFIECLLVAGECDEGGYLPDVPQYAWRVRADAETVETDFVTLADAGLLSQDNGAWLVTQFAERQAPVSGAERVARHRERQKKAEYYEGDTGPLRNGNDSVTKRYTDIDIDIDKDEIRTDTEREATPAQIGGASKGTQEVLNHFVDCTDILPPPHDQLDKWREWWILPLNSLLDMCQDDTEKTTTLIDEALRHMDENGLTYARPGSLVNVARTLVNGNVKELRFQVPEPFDNRMKGLEEALENEGLA
jgi:hypothetical protein